MHHRQTGPGDEWLTLVERTLRGAIDVGSVTAAVEPTTSSEGPDAATIDGVMVIRRPVAGDEVVMTLRRPHRPFTDPERALAVRILHALEIPPGASPDALPPTLLADVLERALHALDDAVAIGVEARLGVVGDLFAARLDAGGWWLGRLVGDELVEVARGLRRAAPGADRTALRVRVDADDEQILHVLEGGSLSAWVGDDSARAENLRDHGVVTTVVAGGYDPDARQWVLGLYGDDVSPDLRHAQAPLSASVQAALGFPRPPRG